MTTTIFIFSGIVFENLQKFQMILFDCDIMMLSRNTVYHFPIYQFVLYNGGSEWSIKNWCFCWSLFGCLFSAVYGLQTFSFCGIRSELPWQPIIV